MIQGMFLNQGVLASLGTPRGYVQLGRAFGQISLSPSEDGAEEFIQDFGGSWVKS